MGFALLIFQFPDMFTQFGATEGDCYVQEHRSLPGDGLTDHV